jgi:DNA ligase-1
LGKNEYLYYMNITLYNIDSKGKTRYVSFLLIDQQDSNYKRIMRSSGLLGGTDVVQPGILIEVGKAKRTIEEQAILEYKALISKARDKGYKDTIEELGAFKTDSKGNRKPQLAKDPRGKIPNTISEEEARKIIISQIEKITKGKKGYMSKKLDGVRITGRIEDDLKLTSSRGGKDYNAISVKMMADPCIDAFFEKYPDYQLDGEIYVHGKTLDEISGHTRKKEWVESRHADLQFWIFDIIANDLTFEERLKILREIQPETDSVVIVEHVEVNSVDEIMALHDKWFAMGFEGGIWREASADYKEGKDARMIKIKLMQDAEFEIVGATEGLRPEDMVFVMKTENGLIFEAKPVGSVVTRIAYLENINEHIGKKATIKFFHLSPKGVPNLPIFKHIRPDDE